MLVRSCFLLTLNKCLKGHRSLGSLFVCRKSVTRSPIELFWIARNMLHVYDVQMLGISLSRLLVVVLQVLAPTGVVTFVIGFGKWNWETITTRVPGTDISVHP